MLLPKLIRVSSKLAQPRLGVYSALIGAALCVAGSLLSRFAPNFHHRHVAGFWWAPRWHDVWTFGLLVALAVFLLHAALRLKLAFGSNRPADAMSHSQRWRAIGLFAIVASLASYAWFVIAARSEEFRVTNTEANIHGEYYRVIRVEVQRRTDTPRPMAVAWIERRFGSAVEKMRVERGKWWHSRVGNYELALARARLSADGAVFRHGDRTVTLGLGRPAPGGFFALILRGLHHRTRDPSSEVHQAEVEIGGQKKVLPVDPEWAGESAFLGMKSSPVILLRVHRNLTFPLAALAIFLVLLAYGLARFEGRPLTRTLP